ncbi:hypothetical protein ACOME3_006156 [Neoechinorhynchus agilis]
MKSCLKRSTTLPVSLTDERAKLKRVHFAQYVQIHQIENPLENLSECAIEGRKAFRSLLERERRLKYRKDIKQDNAKRRQARLIIEANERKFNKNSGEDQKKPKWFFERIRALFGCKCIKKDVNNGIENHNDDTQTLISAESTRETSEEFKSSLKRQESVFENLDKMLYLSKDSDQY